MKEHNQPLYSARQRTIVLTFANPEAAQAWDDAGQPLADLPLASPAVEVMS